MAWRDLWRETYTTHSPDEIRILRLLLGQLQTQDWPVTLADIGAIRQILRKNEPFEVRLKEVKQRVDEVKERPNSSATVAELENERVKHEARELSLEDEYGSLVAKRYGPYSLAHTVDTAGDSTVPVPNGNGTEFLFAPEISVVESASSKIAAGICVPSDPMLDILRWRVETNLEKIRTGRNIVGMQRQLQTYASPVDPTAAIQRAAVGGQVDELIPSEPPPIFRFSFLVERARYYVGVAQQLETLLLASYEKYDDALYNWLKAKQDLKTAQANLALQALRITEARNGIELAKRQQERAQIQENYFAGLLNAGLLPFEQEAIERLWTAHDFTYAASVFGGIGGLAAAAVGAIFGSPGGPPGMAAGVTLGGIAGAIMTGGQTFRDIASIHSTASQARSLQASYMRRT
jgi:hypothetical protein